MVLPIYILGQPVLRKVAEDIPTDYPDLDQFLKDMWDTLAERRHRIGSPPGG